MNVYTTCDLCNGLGRIIICTKDYVSEFTNICPKCSGNGDLNWLEVIFGKKYEIVLNAKIFNSDFTLDSYLRDQILDIYTKVDSNTYWKYRMMYDKM